MAQPAPALDPTWGPFHDAGQAHVRLARHLDRTCAPGLGIAWEANGQLFPLRAPVTDRNGMREIVVFRWRPVAAPRPHPAPPPPDTMDRIRGALSSFLSGAEKKASTIAHRASAHWDDSAAMALDVVGVAFGVVTVVAGAEVIGVAALAGGLFLLAADGAAYVSELAGNEKRAEEIKQRTEVARIIATVMTLPDLAFGITKSIREYQEARALLPEAKRMLQLDQNTARAADHLAQTTPSANRAAKYQDIAERANLRAQLRGEQIAATRLHEVVPHSAGIASVGLFVRDEGIHEESVVRETVRRLEIHCVVTHK